MFKRVMLVLCMLCMFSGVAMAKDVILVPVDCEVENAKFSSGGGDSSFIYVEVLCKYPNGRQVLYLDTKVSVGGFFGAGRITMPSKIEIIKTTKVVDKIKFK